MYIISELVSWSRDRIQKFPKSRNPKNPEIGKSSYDAYCDDDCKLMVWISLELSCINQKS